MKYPLAGLLSATACLTASLAAPAHAQHYPVTPAQRATAQQVAEAGVPIEELAADAPDQYTVKRGDTLWAISGLYLKRPWRWPELWGMNLQDIRNPHLIYPGQVLYLEKKDGRAVLRTARPATGAGSEPGASETVRLTPRTRVQMLPEGALPTLPPHLIEPFLTEALVVDELALRSAPRIVAARGDRVLLSRGDRAYARGEGPSVLVDEAGKPRQFRVFRNAVPLKDPYSGELLGYEAQHLGRADLARGESTAADATGKGPGEPVPATIDIVSAKEEMRAGDRLLPEPPRQLQSYVPRAPQAPVSASVVSVYGNAVRFAAQNQVVVINRGTRDGLEAGHVLALLKAGPRLVDKTDSARTTIQLPDERNGLAMVFRPFERVSYALILQITDTVNVGDRLVNPK